jgi:hypothetical protein
MDHFKTMVNANTNKPGFDDYFSFLWLPLIISGLFILIGFDVDSNTIETIVGSLAIFVGLLFNALVILLDIARKHQRQEIKQLIVKELTANISFSILVSFAAIFVMLLGFLDNVPQWIKMCIDFVAFFLLTEFLLIFLMILKRTYLIFEKELDELNS